VKPAIRKLEPQPRNYRYSADALVEVPNESYGHKLRRLRLALDLTQREVAEMVGCHKQAISNWERGIWQGNTPEAAQLPRYAIRLLSERLRKRRLTLDRLDSGGLANGSPGRDVGLEPLASLPARRVRRA